jgi:DNA-binding NtrC family response regulator
MTDIVIADYIGSPGALAHIERALELARPGMEAVVTRAPALADVVAVVRAEQPRLVVLVADGGCFDGAVRPILAGLVGEGLAPSVVVAGAGMAAGDVAGALAGGAREFLGLPITLAEAAGRLRHAIGDRREGCGDAGPVPGFIGRNAGLLEELRKIPVVAGCDATVLITGETGTGKELCAQAIHALSRRRQRPFVPINCGAIPPDLVENELFGHERGAFTGASNGRPGLVHEADGGTLFLDEVNSLPLAAQVKLLRLLQDGTFRALGSTRLQRADLRVIAATSDDLNGAVAAGRFRQDLYYRLNVVPLRLPPLRARRDDIPGLVQFFVDRHARRVGRPVRGVSPDALTRLAAHGWPGNVRELEHVIERAVVLSRSPLLGAGDIALGEDDAPGTTSFQHAKAQVVSEFERHYLRSMLSQHRGNISHAAVAAGKDRRAFWELLRKHAIDPRAYRSAARRDEPRMAS